MDAGNEQDHLVSYGGFKVLVTRSRFPPPPTSPAGSVIENPPANAEDTGDMGSNPGLGRSPGVGNGNLFQYSCLENSTDK